MLFEMAKKKKSKKEKPAEPVAAPPTLQAPGAYLRESGFLYLTEQFDSEKITPIAMKIAEYNLMPEELRPERITLLINSPGGRVDSCKMLLDMMQQSAIPVDTVGSGMVASCGVVTLMAGAKRLASPTCQIMSHQYSAGAGGKEHELYGRVKSFNMTSNWMEEHYIQHTGLKRKFVRKHLLGPTDVWLSAEEALEYNIIDGILE